MKIKQIFIFLLLSLVCKDYSCDYIFSNTEGESQCNWAVVGAGPAGIITIGLLMDLGISPSSITWIDPEFNVGRLGKYYASVPANTKTKLFVQFLESCKTFQECKTASFDKLLDYDQEKEYPLEIIIQPLKDISDYLVTKVQTITGNLTSLEFEKDCWHVGISDKKIAAHNVVLATGSKPRSLDYPCEHEIPLDLALSKDVLADHVQHDDCIAVIGSSHSAILILKFLTELNVKRIINFYKNPIQYAVDMGTWILHNANGLKGITAQWAREVLEKNPPANILRIYNSEQARESWLQICNKIIYAVGYERNELPPIHGNNTITYDDKTGIIAPRLFGIGIAFPEEYTDPLGNKEHRVGLNSFMDYAQRIIPEWIKKDARSRFASFDQLFTIDIL